LPPLRAANANAAARGPEVAPLLPLLPPMGFNTWNRYHCWIDEKTADLLVKLGLRAAG